MTGSAITAALTPVRVALLAAAHAAAARTLAEADADAATTLARAAAEAGHSVSDGRTRGTAEATASLAAQQIQARRQRRTAELTGRRDAYEELARRSADAVCALRDRPGYPALRDGLIARARELLGPDAVITEDPRGGIIACATGRRLDYTLAAFAARALDRLGEEVTGLWTP